MAELIKFNEMNDFVKHSFVYKNVTIKIKKKTYVRNQVMLLLVQLTVS